MCDDHIPEDCKSGRYKHCQMPIYNEKRGGTCEMPWDWDNPVEDDKCEDKGDIKGLLFKDTCRRACDYCRENSKNQKYTFKLKIFFLDYYLRVT